MGRRFGNLFIRDAPGGAARSRLARRHVRWRSRTDGVLGMARRRWPAAWDRCRDCGTRCAAHEAAGRCADCCRWREAAGLGGRA
jgi:hypothetical protein